MRMRRQLDAHLDDLRAEAATAQSGTVVIREYQGERHTVAITGEGFRWRGQDYSSLTAIARTITGSNWNGPRFFGLREGPESSEDRAGMRAVHWRAVPWTLGSPAMREGTVYAR